MMNPFSLLVRCKPPPRNCQNVIFFEARKKKDTFMWISPNTSNGPTIRFLVENVHTTSELKFAGNCLARSRPLLSFHGDFDSSPELQLVKLCLQKTFNTPRGLGGGLVIRQILKQNIYAGGRSPPKETSGLRYISPGLSSGGKFSALAADRPVILQRRKPAVS